MWPFMVSCHLFSVLPKPFFPLDLYDMIHIAILLFSILLTCCFQLV